MDDGSLLWNIILYGKATLLYGEDLIISGCEHSHTSSNARTQASRGRRTYDSFFVPIISFLFFVLFIPVTIYHILESVS